MAERSVPNPILVDFGDPERQGRWSIFFRHLLAFPNSFVYVFVAFGAYFVILFNWFAALVLGRLPQRSANFLVGYLRWAARLNAYYFLLTGRYPPYSGKERDDDVVFVSANPGRLRRLSVLFRFLLWIPAGILAALLSTGYGVFSPIIWLITLVRGSMPPSLFRASALVQRYVLRTYGYEMLLTSTYPRGAFGDRPESSAAPLPPPAGFPSVPLGGPASVWSPATPTPSYGDPAGPAAPVEAGPTSTPESSPWVPTGTPEAVPVPFGATAASTAEGAPLPAWVTPPPTAAPRWEIAATPSVKVLLSVFIALSVLFYAGIIAVIVVAATTSSVLTQTENAVAALNGVITPTNSVAQSCPAASGRVCIENVLREQGDAYDTLANTISGIEYPSAVAAMASGMQRDAAMSGAIYLRLAASPTEASLTQASTTASPTLTSLLNDFNAKFNLMKAAYGDLVVT